MGPIARRATEIGARSRNGEIARRCDQIVHVDLALDDWVAERFKKGIGTEDDYFRVMDVTDAVRSLLASEAAPYSVAKIQECLDTLNNVLKSLPH